VNWIEVFVLAVGGDDAVTVSGPGTVKVVPADPLWPSVFVAVTVML
jgi:hypothetical protein